MKLLGRIIAREGAAGLYIPYSQKLEEGIYDVQEIMGELVLKRVGNFHGDSKRADALELSELFGERVSYGMTTDELKQAGQL